MRNKRPQFQLDKFDLNILMTLQRKGRMSKVELADKVGLSPSPCLMRLKRLEEAGFILGYRAEVDIGRLISTTTVLTEIVLQSHQADDFAQFEKAIMEIPEIVECSATGGGIDYLLKSMVLDIDHYQGVIESLLEMKVGISRYFSYVVTKPIKKDQSDPIGYLLDVKRQRASARET